jgi:hypothetical protein
MISLNLLPPGRKEAFRWRQHTKKVISIGIRMIFLLICFSVPLFAINIYLSGEINAINTEIKLYEDTESIQRLNTMERSFKNINNALIKINKISDEQISWFDVFEKITIITPSNIQVLSLQIDSDGKFVIVGNAETREDVLEFGKRLKNSTDFSDIQTPLDNLIRSTNIDFKFTGKVLLDRFKVNSIKKDAGAK